MSSKSGNPSAPKSVRFVIDLSVMAGSGVPRGGGLGSSTPLPPEIPKALQNRAKLNQIV